MKTKFNEFINESNSDNLLDRLKPHLIGGEYLYHYTLTYNLDEIMSDGLIPRKYPNSHYEKGAEGVFLTNSESLYKANLPQELMDTMSEYYDNGEEGDKPIVRLKIKIINLDANKFTYDDDYKMNSYKWNKANGELDKIVESLNIWGSIAYLGTIPKENIIGHDFDYGS